MKSLRTLILLMGLTIATSAPARDSVPQQSEYEYDYETSAQQVQEPEESASHYDAYIQEVQADNAGKKGFSRGSGLRTIAVGSANQAKTALGNQAAAAYQAAYVAKNTLAQSAAQSSATAQAALAGKQVILSGLEQQVRDAKVAVQGEEMQLQQAKRAAQSAAQAAQQAMHQVNVIQAALNAAQATSENANEAASQAAGELGAQTAMVGAARQRLQTLTEQLHGVRIDFEATQAAARKAQAAAQQAQANAAAAAAKAAAAGLASHKDTSHEETRDTASTSLHTQTHEGLTHIDSQANITPKPIAIKTFELATHSVPNKNIPVRSNQKYNQANQNNHEEIRYDLKNHDQGFYNQANHDEPNNKAVQRDELNPKQAKTVPTKANRNQIKYELVNHDQFNNNHDQANQKQIKYELVPFDQTNQDQNNVKQANTVANRVNYNRAIQIVQDQGNNHSGNHNQVNYQVNHSQPKKQVYSNSNFEKIFPDTYVQLDDFEDHSSELKSPQSTLATFFGW